MTIAIFWILFAVAVGIFASNKGRSGFGWFVLSLVISPLLGIIFCAVSKDLSPGAKASAPSLSTHRKCPACAELILPEAVICKHCQSPVKADPSYSIQAAKEADYQESKKYIIGVLAIVSLFVFAGLMSKCTG